MYSFSIFLASIVLIFGPIAMIVFVSKPELFHRLTKLTWSRKGILGKGSGILLSSFMLFAIVGSATEPASVKAEREKKQAEGRLFQAKKIEESEALKPVIKTEKKTSDIAFKTSNKDDATLEKGQENVLTEGTNGQKTSTYEVTYVKGVETGRKLTKEEVTILAVDKVVAIGTYVKPASIQQYYSAPSTSASSSSTPSTSYTPAPSQSTSTYYANCSAAKAAGAAPIYAGQPGYGKHLDRDGDGIGCEK